MTKRIDRLEQQKLVERLSHPTDRRAWIIRLTDNGRTLAKKPMPKVAPTAFALKSVRYSMRQSGSCLRIICSDSIVRSKLLDSALASQVNRLSGDLSFLCLSD
jgi:DNA-binding MarR family transcriptional regulator